MKNNEEMALALGGKTFIDEVYEENLKQRKIILNQQIDENVVETVTMQILKWNTEDIGSSVKERIPIKLYINSVGGDVFNGLNLCDVIKNSVTPVYGIVMGYAYSMGGVIFLSTHKKYMFESSSLLIHDGNTSLSGSAGKVKDLQKFYEKVDGRLKNIIVGNSKMTSEEYDENYDRELYLLADECKEKGICDYIIGQDCSIEEIL